jgi:integrase
MSVRRRQWISPNGEPKEAWVVDYRDQHGHRHIKTFAKKRDADAHHAIVGVAVRAGTHTADSKSVTVAKAAELWLESCEAAGLERTTLARYREHANLHVIPVLGALRLSQLTVPLVRGFEDRLRRDGRSPVMVRIARRALGALLADAQERGLVAQNVVYSMRKHRRSNRVDGNGKLKIGIDIPSPAEMRAIVAKLDHAGRHRPLLLTAPFTGLRASELRGLPWRDVDLKRGEIHVRQRADRYGKIGRTKSEAGERTVPLPPMIVAALREHKLASPKNELDLVFANSKGNIEHRNTIVEHGFHPAQVAAGVTKPGKDGEPVAKYAGLHALRHFYASWCINRRVDGGLELPLKVVQARLGHASIQMTADVYGHLFPRSDDGAELAAAERAFLGG